MLWGVFVPIEAFIAAVFLRRWLKGSVSARPGDEPISSTAIPAGEELREPVSDVNGTATAGTVCSDEAGIVLQSSLLDESEREV